MTVVVITVHDEVNYFRAFSEDGDKVFPRRMHDDYPQLIGIGFHNLLLDDPNLLLVLSGILELSVVEYCFLFNNVLAYQKPHIFWDWICGLTVPVVGERDLVERVGVEDGDINLIRLFRFVSVNRDCFIGFEFEDVLNKE